MVSYLIIIANKVQRNFDGYLNTFNFEIDNPKTKALAGTSIPDFPGFPVALFQGPLCISDCLPGASQ